MMQEGYITDMGVKIITKSEKGRAGSLVEKGKGGHAHEGIWTVGILDCQDKGTI